MSQDDEDDDEDRAWPGCPVYIDDLFRSATLDGPYGIDKLNCAIRSEPDKLKRWLENNIKLDGTDASKAWVCEYTLLAQNRARLARNGEKVYVWDNPKSYERQVRMMILANAGGPPPSFSHVFEFYMPNAPTRTPTPQYR